MKTTRQVARLTGAASLAFCLLGGLGVPTIAASGAMPSDGQVAHVARREGQAVGLRVALLCFVGLALGGGTYAQYRSLVALRRPDRLAPFGDLTDNEVSDRDMPAHVGTSVTTTTSPSRWQPSSVPQPPPPSAQLRQLPTTPPVSPIRTVVPPAPSLTVAEEYCNQAFAASWRYDRRTARAAFASALASDPEVRPANLPGFWELPSGGHADLVRAYLDRGQILDARSILTFATMHFPHNRELEALVREANQPPRGERSA